MSSDVPFIANGKHCKAAKRQNELYPREETALSHYSHSKCKQKTVLAVKERGSKCMKKINPISVKPARFLSLPFTRLKKFGSLNISTHDPDFLWPHDSSSRSSRMGNLTLGHTAPDVTTPVLSHDGQELPLSGWPRSSQCSPMCSWACSCLAPLRTG